MDFKQVEERFEVLKSKFAEGTLSETDFKAQLEELMIQDEKGDWWMIGYETGQWYRNDGNDWVHAEPPGYISKLSANERKAKEEADHLTAQKAKADQKNIVSNSIEQTAGGTKSRKTIDDRLQIWWSRGLIVTVVMTVLGFILASYYGIEQIVIFSIVIGVFGFMFYPHKTAYILTVVFSVIGYLFIHELYSSLGFGFIVSAIISRILHAIKMI